MAFAPIEDPTSTSELNRRLAASSHYRHWLYRIYAGAELAEMADEPEPVSLRQIFVPLRVSETVLPEASLAGPSEAREQETVAAMPGMDAFKLLEESSFVCLAGLPGSGKTTLVKAIIAELCGDHYSELSRALVGTEGITPVPIILRELSGFERMRSMADLMAAWWESLAKRTQGSLDIERLRYRFTPKAQGGDGMRLLVLFDGIDETGGADVRERILEFAREAHDEWGCRVLVTGRPNGFGGIGGHRSFSHIDISHLVDGSPFVTIVSDGLMDAQVIKLHHVLPLTWPQIQSFIVRWYGLRPEWEIKRNQGTSHFLEALGDPARPYLLNLARRPIFLTLMALVHCTDNEMPHGRAELYRRIVDLYLHRQERHRQIKYSTKGKLLKPWPAEDKRRVLGHIAYQSQIRGSEAEKARNEPDSRRILWPRAELVTLIRDYLAGRSGFGIAAEEAEDLLDYFLHPAGLLIEPREGEISFTHLSFQEYLCAEDIQRRLSGRKFEQTFREELMDRLDKPGWDEVGLLLLVIHKQQTNDGHLELLDILYEARKEMPCARLFVQAWCGRELGFLDEQRQGQLPKLAECCVENPSAEFSRYFKEWFVAWESHGLAWTIDQLRKQPHDRRLSGLLGLIHEANWGCREDKWNPISSDVLAETIANCLSDEASLWMREERPDIPAGLAKLTLAGSWVDVLLPANGVLYRRVLAHLPIDAWLLQGVCINRPSSISYCSQHAVLLSAYPREALLSRSVLALGLYPVILLIEREWKLCDAWVSQSFWSNRTLWFNRFLSFLDRLEESPLLFMSLMNPRLLPILDRKTVSHLQWRSLAVESSVAFNLRELPPLFLRSKTLYQVLTGCMNVLISRAALSGNRAVSTSASTEYISALQCFGYQYAADSWFREAAEDPDLVRRRGLRPGEPLPRHLGLFDDRGMPLERQRRDSFLKLQSWLHDDDAVLAFFFPDGLTPEDETVLRKDLGILKQQPWSPQAFVQATLDAWPEHEAEQDWSYARMEQDMLAACEKFLAETE